MKPNSINVILNDEIKNKIQLENESCLPRLTYQTLLMRPR
jgi:hypothetical protein